jgi:hypothetical protein
MDPRNRSQPVQRRRLLAILERTPCVSLSPPHSCVSPGQAA